MTDTETISSMAHHLRLMKSCIDNYYTVFPFSKNSPLTPYVNNKVTQLTSAGIIEHWFDMMTVKYGKSYMAEFFDNRVLGSEAKPLKIRNVVGAFYLLGIGLIVSGVAFLAEIFVYRRKSLYPVFI